jgi:hypothetical protein
MKFNYIYIIVIIIALGIGIYFLQNKNKGDNKKYAEKSTYKMKEQEELEKLNKNDIVYILNQPIKYKDNSIPIYSPFDETKIPPIKNTFDQIRSPYFRINKDNKFEFIEDEKNDNLIKMKEYFIKQDLYLNNLNGEQKAAAELYLDETYKQFKNFLLKRQNPIYDFTTMRDDKKDRFNLIRKDLNDPRLIMNKVSTVLNEVIYNAPKLPVPLTVFRGTISDPNFLQNLTLDQNGNYIYDIKSFMSTSILHNIPVGLDGTRFVDFKSGCCMWIIYLPANINALFIKKNKIATGAGEELEILLPVGGKLKLLEATKKYTKYDISYILEEEDLIKYSPKIDTYIWEYIPPISDNYTIELYRYL